MWCFCNGFNHKFAGLPFWAHFLGCTDGNIMYHHISIFKQPPPFPRGVLLTSQRSRFLSSFLVPHFSLCTDMYHKIRKSLAAAGHEKDQLQICWQAMVMVCIWGRYLESISATWALFAMQPPMWWLHTLPNNSIKSLTWKEAVAKLYFCCAHMVINYKSCRGFHTQQ